MVAQVQLNDGRLGDQLIVDVLDFDHYTAVQRLVLVGMVVLIAGRKGRAGQGQGEGGEKGLCFHENPFGMGDASG